MNDLAALFREDHIQGFVARARSRFADHAFLYDWTVREMRDRLSDITRTFSAVLITGPCSLSYFNDLFPDARRMEFPTPESLADTPETFDLILSLGDLHHANDLPGLLIQMRRALKPDGVFLAAFAGGESLHELRAALMQAELDICGGASPRVFPFASKPQIAGLLQRAGFALPVVDSEVISVAYRDMFHLLSDIRGMGESNALAGRSSRFTSSRLFFQAAQYYHQHFAAEETPRVNATYEIVFVIGWAPHESQQKPAKPGSGQVSLTDVL